MTEPVVAPPSHIAWSNARNGVAFAERALIGRGALHRFLDPRTVGRDLISSGQTAHHRVAITIELGNEFGRHDVGAVERG